MRRHRVIMQSWLVCVFLVGLQAGLGAAPAGKQLIELRWYHFASEEQREAFGEFAGRVAIPALNRAGVEPVGLFRLEEKDNPELAEEFRHPLLCVVMPHRSMGSVAGLMQRLVGDGDLQAEGSGVLLASKDMPAYTRYESSLLLGFDEAPGVEVVSHAPGRIIQLRIYESHSVERALKKVAMFNEGGEIAIFRKCGMPPVFFGQALVGLRLPNLTYMLAFDDEGAQERAWAAFREDPDWKALRSDPQYADTVSRITNLILRPVAGSQL